MNQHRQRRDRDDQGELARPPGRSSEASRGGEVGALLDLQETAGNQAVGELLGGAGPASIRGEFAPLQGTLQREEDDPTDEVDDQVTGVSADEVAGEASDQVTGVSADQVAGEASDQVTGVSADEVAGEASDQVTGVSADEVTEGVAEEALGATADLGRATGGSGSADSDVGVSNLSIPKLSLVLPLRSARIASGPGRGTTELTVTMRGDAPDPRLFQAATTGESLGTIVLLVSTTKLVVTDAVVSSLQISPQREITTIQFLGSLPRP